MYMWFAKSNEKRIKASLHKKEMEKEGRKSEKWKTL